MSIYHVQCFQSEFMKSQNYPPKVQNIQKKSQDMYKSDILPSEIVLFLNSIVDSKVTLTYSNKYNVFDINYYNSIP